MVSAPARRFSAAARNLANVPSFTRELFKGKISEAVYPFPAPTAEVRETMASIVEPVDAFFKEQVAPRSREMDDTHTIPDDIKKGLGELGLYGMMIPESLGGVGLNNSCSARLSELIGSYDLGVGVHLGAHQSIGLKGILLYGTDEQKAKYLPKLATGEHVAAFVLTEPGAGSDVSSIKTSAKLSADGKHWIVNGSKVWISNSGLPNCKVMTLFAKTPIKNPKTGEEEMKITAFIVEKDYAGITTSPPEDKMGIKCSNTCSVYFDNTPIPVENVLGEPGNGFKIAMNILNAGRFGLGAACAGTMKSVIGMVTDHLKQRVQFGKTLNEFGSVKGKIASMNARCYAAESLAYLLAGMMDLESNDYLLEAACSKVFASEAAFDVTDEAIQLMGGLGFMRALPYERILRDLRIFRIFEGSNPILMQLVGLTGLQSLGKDMAPLQAAMKSPLTNLGTLLPFAVEMAKNKVGIVENPKITWAPAELADAARVVEEASGKIGVVSRDLLMKHGKKIIDAQLPVEKLADAVIETTALASALSRATRAVQEKAPTMQHEINMVNLFAAEAKRRINANLTAAAGADNKIDKLKYVVADHVFVNCAYDATHPMGK